MKKMFQADDGKVFESELECLSYENLVKQNFIFEKSRFFSKYGSEYEKYDSFGVQTIYIHPSEFVKMETYLKTKNRTISGDSTSNIYYLRNMTFYPIESHIERERKKLEDITRTIQDLNKLKQHITNETKE